MIYIGYISINKLYSHMHNGIRHTNRQHHIQVLYHHHKHKIDIIYPNRSLRMGGGGSWRREGEGEVRELERGMERDLEGEGDMESER